MKPKADITTTVDKAGPSKPNIRWHPPLPSNEEPLADAVDFGRGTSSPPDLPQPPGGTDSSFTIARQGQPPVRRAISPSQSVQVKVRARGETGIPMNAVADETEGRFPVFGSMKDADSRTQMVWNRAKGA